MKKYILIVIMVLVIPVIIKACPNGDKAFLLMQYNVAIQEYEKCVKSGQMGVQVLERLAESYKVLDKTVEAEKYYKLLLKSKPTSKPTQLQYVNMLIVNGKQGYCKQFLDSLSKKSTLSKELLSKQSVLEEKGKMSAEYEVSHVPFNSTGADFSPIKWRGNIVFSSTGHNINKLDKFTGQDFSSILIFDTLSQVSKTFDEILLTKYNAGSCSFTSDGNEMYFTANERKGNDKGTAVLGIYHTKWNNGHWDKPQKFAYNKPNSNVTHPAINARGDKLVFVGDESRSSGMDLYFCEKNTLNQWTKPLKMDKQFNTSGNEAFPVFLDDTTLVFSSDGLGGKGGLDIFISYFKNQLWSNPIQLSEPFNSRHDDYGLYTDDHFESGYFTSTRSSKEGNEDIFSFRKKQNMKYLQIAIFNKTTQQYIPNQWVTISTSAETQNGNTKHDFALFTIRNGDQTHIMTEYLNIKYDSTIVKDMIIKDTTTVIFYYHDQPKVIEEPKMDPPIIEKTTVFVDKIPNILTIEAGNTFVLNNILYEFDKWDIVPEAATELDQWVTFLNNNKSIKIELSSHTDSRGNDEYNMSLSLKRAESAVQYLIKNGIDGQRMTFAGKGESMLINECSNDVKCTSEQHHQNRRTEIKILEK